MTLLAVSSLAFAVLCYCTIELILLISAQDALGAPRQIDNVFLVGPRFNNFGVGFQLAPPPNRQQALLDERWERWEELAPVAIILVHLTFWPASLFLFIWLYRAHKNLPGLNAQGLSFTPAWAFIAFFVPVFNFFVPFAFMQEIWRASHPHAIDTPQAWRQSPYRRSLRVWWLLYVASIVFWVSANFTRPGVPETYDELWTSAWLAAAASICSAGAGVLLIYIIRKITQRQHERYSNL